MIMFCHKCQDSSKRAPIDESMYQSAISGEEALSEAIEKTEIVDVSQFFCFLFGLLNFDRHFKVEYRTIQLWVFYQFFSINFF